ncbi:hypothetical protein L336_0364 [Candidatus Saccharimonas aalborgensis]|uniref:Uncharacterized protein n=1 Tax=Candidatus Saccharimonas aalborgensis TaxID=1332188 RepID=R4PWE3_9BACT|nr:hypothetical protein L336_0364 [Candidatus Saccharimonas aalborgensis]
MVRDAYQRGSEYHPEILTIIYHTVAAINAILEYTANGREMRGTNANSCRTTYHSHRRQLVARNY